MYLSIYIYNLGTRGQSTGVNPVRNHGARWTKAGSVLVLYMTKQSRGVLGEMRYNARIRMQRSRASGAGKLLSYGRYVPGGPWRPMGVPRGSQGRAWGVPRGPRGLQGLAGDTRHPFHKHNSVI